MIIDSLLDITVLVEIFWFFSVLCDDCIFFFRDSFNGNEPFIGNVLYPYFTVTDFSVVTDVFFDIISITQVYHLISLLFDYSIYIILQKSYDVSIITHKLGF